MPISISGWGLRKIAVISLLGQYTIAPEKALLFSVSPYHPLFELCRARTFARCECTAAGRGRTSSGAS
jgi:hypothetical protein